MNWFKLLWLSSEERKILKEAEQDKNNPKPVVTTQTATSYATPYPYKNLYYSNNNLTVVFKDGTMISKSGVDKDTFDKVRGAYTQQVIENLMVTQVIAPTNDALESKAEKQLVLDNLDILRKNPDFNICGQDVFLTGVNLALPAIVISSFIEILEKKNYQGDKYVGFPNDEYRALKMFWLKLALNTLPQSREDLLFFVKKNDVQITRNGNLVLYRRIVSVGEGNKELIKFVSQEYYRIKKQGLQPKDYAVLQDGESYKTVLANEVFVLAGLMGNLQILYLDLPSYEDNTYTSSHNRGVMTIKIGSLYKIPEDGINLDNGLCAAGGLHAAAVDYDYSGFGDTPVVVLVNPSKAITVPRGEMGKLRTTEMFIAAINDKPAGQHFDETALAAFDEEYHDLTLEELEQALLNKSFETLAVKDNVPVVSLIDLKAITNMLKSRIKQI